MILAKIIGQSGHNKMNIQTKYNAIIGGKRLVFDDCEKKFLFWGVTVFLLLCPPSVSR